MRELDARATSSHATSSHPIVYATSVGQPELFVGQGAPYSGRGIAGGHDDGSRRSRSGDAHHSVRHGPPSRSSLHAASPYDGGGVPAAPLPLAAPPGSIGSPVPTYGVVSAFGQTLRSQKHTQPSEPEKHKERRASEHQVHEQLRALLVAKETALSAVAQL